MEATPDQTQATPPGAGPAPAISWDWLHNAVLNALRHIEPGAPLYLTGDVLTDELLPPLKGTS